ncbi:MAG TPA: protein kinase [Steroidobacteraceae bacterium]|nr:protein kinase [Steroidobacteraceae bacterium]
MSDAAALDWLDRLLSADEPQRRVLLGELSAIDPALRARVERLLASALSPDHSRVLARPVVDGMARMTLESASALAAGQVLAGYRLIRELGRGGMSVVWLAERADGVVKRQVALKMPMFILQGEGDLARFVRERDALATLSHPNVARLYDAGVLPSGQPFIVLEHVDGVPLTVYCDERRLDVLARLRLYFQVLSAVDHAHKHLLVHRDLKPSNILVDAEGQVKLLDFGIAKLLAEGDAATAPLTEQAGAAMTPLYAAPEQLRGNVISTLTDVYSLGVVLHELLSGALPYVAPKGGRASLVDVLETQARGELPRASQAPVGESAAIARGTTVPRLRAALAGDLDTIIGKALRLAPEQRYDSAAHLAEDLRRFLSRRPIAARRPGFLYTARLALARHRLAASIGGAGLVLVAGAAVVAWQQHLASVAHEKRTAAVRDFMFDLVNDAEAVEGHEGEVTGRQMVEGAVIRARRDFGAQPQLQGELLGELGRMYIRLGAAGDAVPVLAQSVDVLEKQAPPDDAALNKARAFLATALLETSDDAPRIRELANQAHASCANSTIDCAKTRAYASAALSQLASMNGDFKTALAEMRNCALDMQRAFGPDHEETAIILMRVAILARNAGELVEAGAAMSRAMAIVEPMQLRAVDRAEFERSMAVIDLDLGRYEAARDRLRALLSQSAASEGRATQRRLLATAYVELGDANAAMEAIPGEVPDEEWVYTQQVRARALGMAGRNEEALAEIDAVIARFLADGNAVDSFAVMRAQRYRAQILVQAGRDAEALQLLRDLRDRHGNGKGTPVERGLMLDALGAAELRAGNGEKSHLAHEAARTELLKQLPQVHPHVIRNTALRAGH